jgi:hypothetical protein
MPLADELDTLDPNDPGQLHDFLGLLSANSETALKHVLAAREQSAKHRECRSGGRARVDLRLKSERHRLDVALADLMSCAVRETSCCSASWTAAVMSFTPKDVVNKRWSSWKLEVCDCGAVTWSRRRRREALPPVYRSGPT